MKIDQVLIDLVKEEAAKLRKNLTKEEADRLNFSRLEPQSRFQCIYGQATGNCHSDRATALIIKCCSKTYVAEGTTIDKSPLNGKPTKETVFGEGWIQRVHFSPIEKFLYLAGKRRNKKLIQYLRKETNTLDI